MKYLSILHFSDMHGETSLLEGCPSPEHFDAVVCTGDLCPNKTRGKRKSEVPYQSEWVINNVLWFRSLCQDKPFLLTRGNHDFADICTILRRAGIRAHALERQPYGDGPFVHRGVVFAGLPHIPFIAGEWNFEAHPGAELRYQTDLALEPDPHVLAAHCPPYGILDGSDCGDHFGNAPLSNIIAFEKPRRLHTVLCGHVHSHGGQHAYDPTIGVHVFNNATTWRVVKIPAPEFVGQRRV